jgi:hypothetical protein
MSDGSAGGNDSRSDDGEGKGDREREESVEALRERVEEEYDFDDFGPRDMAEMSAAEWEAAFDADTWITGTELLDRVERDLRARIARRDVFAVLERERRGDRERLVAYSDEGYALVYEDGTVEGRGTVLRDVKPSVALCSMEDYDVPAVPERDELPDPEAVPEGGGDLGNKVMLAVGAVQLLAGLGLFGAWVAMGLSVIAAVVAFGFITFGIFLLALVANARLSDRFRAEEYRDRLRAAGVESGDRPAFVPDWEDGEGGEDRDTAA